MSQASDSESYKAPTDLKARLAESYDRLAPTYNSWTYKHDSPRLTWLAKLLTQVPTASPHLAGDKSAAVPYILELGAGAGLPTTEAILAHKDNFHVLANELSPVQLGLLESNLSQHKDRLTPLLGDMLSLMIEPASLSGVVGMYSIIHLPKAEQVELLHKINTWLVPGGLLLANFSVEDQKEIVAEEWLGVEGAWTYWAGLGVEGTITAIADAQLELLEHEVVDGKGVDADFVWILAKKLSI